jgi:hypothetical protein
VYQLVRRARQSKEVRYALELLDSAVVLLAMLDREVNGTHASDRTHLIRVAPRPGSKRWTA